MRPRILLFAILTLLGSPPGQTAAAGRGPDGPWSLTISCNSQQATWSTYWASLAKAVTFGAEVRATAGKFTFERQEADEVTTFQGELLPDSIRLIGRGVTTTFKYGTAAGEGRDWRFQGEYATPHRVLLRGRFYYRGSIAGDCVGEMLARTATSTDVPSAAAPVGSSRPPRENTSSDKPANRDKAMIEAMVAASPLASYDGEWSLSVSCPGPIELGYGRIPATPDSFTTKVQVSNGQFAFKRAQEHEVTEFEGHLQRDTIRLDGQGVATGASGSVSRTDTLQWRLRGTVQVPVRIHLEGSIYRLGSLYRACVADMTPAPAKIAAPQTVPSTAPSQTHATPQTSAPAFPAPGSERQDASAVIAPLASAPAGETARESRPAPDERARQESMHVSSQPSKPVSSGTGSAVRKALVIGNDSYRSVARLRTARADARSVERALSDIGYRVTAHYDLAERDMKRALREFVRTLAGGDEVVFFYAGHGVQIGGANYLLPVDIGGENAVAVRDEAIALQRVLDDLADARTRFTLAIIDACRDNPFTGASRDIGSRGLAPTSAASGQMIMFSAGTGQQALDRVGSADASPNGLFTRVLLRHIHQKAVPADKILRLVRAEVVAIAKSIGHEQVPALYDQAIGEYYFVR